MGTFSTCYYYTHMILVLLHTVKICIINGNFTTRFLSLVSYMPVYEGNSISKLQIQVATYVFELSARNCHR